MVYRVLSSTGRALTARFTFEHFQWETLNKGIRTASTAEPKMAGLSINDEAHPLHHLMVSTEPELQQMIEELAADSAAYYQNLLNFAPGMAGAVGSFKISCEAEAEMTQNVKSFQAYIMSACVTIWRSKANSPYELATDGEFWLMSFLHWSYTPKPFFLHLAQMKYAQDGRTSAWRRALNFCFSPLYNKTGNDNNFKADCNSLMLEYLRDCMAPIHSRNYDNDELVHHVVHDIVPCVDNQTVFDLICNQLVKVIKENVEAEGLDEDLDFYNQEMSEAARAKNFQFAIVLDA
nr:MAG: hypothetical protein Ga0209084_10007148 [Lavidaviridae sp.]